MPSDLLVVVGAVVTTQVEDLGVLGAPVVAVEEAVVETDPHSCPDP